MKKSNLSSKILEEKFEAYKVSQAQTAKAKEALLQEIQKRTAGKANITYAGVDDCEQWFLFSKENPDWTPRRFPIDDYEQKLIVAPMVKHIEIEEGKERGFTKVYHDVVMSDLRAYQSDSEDSFKDACESENGSIFKEKFKGLKSLVPARRTDEQKEKDFLKSEESRNKRLAKKNKKV